MSDYPTWVKAVWLNARGEPLDFIKRPYLIDIYRDQYPNIVYMKSGQCGLSEHSISEAIWVAEHLGKVVLYVFPAFKQLQEFVQARVNPVLMASDYLVSKIDDVESREKKVETLGLKKIGRGFIYFRGSQNAKQIITVDADMVILDERDRFTEENVPYIDKRLLASNLKWRREISTPTIPGAAIHAAYMNSDQRIWKIKCSHCDYWQELDFFKNIDFEKKTARCVSCGKTLDRLSMGRWVVTNPKSKIHGYKVNGLYNPMVSITTIVDKYEISQSKGFSELQQFYNQDLGLPYEVSGQSIHLTELEKCKDDYYLPVNAKNCYAGADVGVKYIHTIVMQKTGEKTMRIVWAGTVKNFLGPMDSLQQIMEKFDIQVMLIDKKPETKKVQEIMEKYPRKVFAAEYPPNVKFPTQEYYQWDDITCEVRLDRTVSLDYLIGDLQNQRIRFPQNIESIEGFFDHLRAAVRVTQVDRRIKANTSQWVEKGPDHFLHALNYARIAQLKGTIGKALLDYYTKPEEGLSPSFLDWIRVKGERIF